MHQLFSTAARWASKWDAHLDLKTSVILVSPGSSSNEIVEWIEDLTSKEEFRNREGFRKAKAPLGLILAREPKGSKMSCSD